MLITAATDYPYMIDDTGLLMGGESLDAVAPTSSTDSRAITTATGAEMEKKSSGLTSILNSIGGVLGTLGLEVTAGGNGFNVYRTPTAGGNVASSQTGARPWYENPLILIGGGLVVGYLVLRKK